MKKLLMIGMCLGIGLIGMGSYALTLTDVASHATPKLVEEINTTFAEVEVAHTNQNASNITIGNLGINRITNALGTAGSYIAGNIPKAALTNAAATIGSNIGGNIPEAALTNAAASLGDNIGGNIPIAAITNATATGTYSVPAARIDSGNIGLARITNALETGGANIGGNIPEAALTNAAATLGDNIGGNIPQGSITNAIATVGPYIGGNIPAAAITNALAGNTAPVGASTLTISAGVIETPQALSVTNGQTITVAAGKYILSGIGNENTYTNEVSLAVPTVAGQIVKFIGSFTATNAVTFPSSGATRIPVGAVLEDGDDDAITFEAFDTSTWTCTSYINNQ